MSAQCPSCGLHELVPVHLQRAEGGWIQTDKVGLLGRSKHDTSKADVQIDACPVCFGAWFDAGELDTLAGALEGVEKVLEPEGRPTDRPCPHGHGPMAEHDLKGIIRTPLDRCTQCGGVWLDGHERRKLATATTGEGQGTRTQRMLKRGAIWAAQVLTHLPIEVENPARSTPWVVYTILAVLLVVFGMQELGQLDAYYYGLVPGRLRKYGGFENLQTLWTYSFLHGGWGHLLFNAYFLYTFGDNIEHLFGRLRFAVFFVATGILAGAIHYLLTTKTATPVVGASGAISGVLAAYLWAFPRARLFQNILFVPLKIPVWVYIAGWAIFQVAMGLFGSGQGASAVAWFAHAGGFAAGLVIAPIMLRRRRRVVARSVRVPAFAA